MGDDIAVDVSSPSTYIHSHDDSVPAVVSSRDGIPVVVASNTPVTFASIQPSNVLMAGSTNAAMGVLEQASPTAVAVDLTTAASPALLPLEPSASRYACFSRCDFNQLLDLSVYNNGQNSEIAVNLAGVFAL